MSTKVDFAVGPHSNCLIITNCPGKAGGKVLV